MVIFGATGRTGLNMTRKALERGHEVTAPVLPNPAVLALHHAWLRLVKADVMDIATLDGVLEGQDAVITSISVRSG